MTCSANVARIWMLSRVCKQVYGYVYASVMIHTLGFFCVGCRVLTCDLAMQRFTKIDRKALGVEENVMPPMEVMAPTGVKLFVPLEEIAANNYHTRVVLSRGLDGSWTWSTKHVVLDTCPVAIPLCTVSEAIQNVLIKNRMVFTTASDVKYFLNPQFCLRLLKFCIMQTVDSVRKGVENMRLGDETVLWCDSHPVPVF
jgi:hypothetical protein